LAVKEEDPRRFLDPKTISRISRLDLRARRVVEGFVSGMHRSPFFGHSVEFVQHRDYTAGDDIRHLDWKVWSKTDKYYIKQFEEETNLRCQLVVDVSNSMHYGRGAMNKYDYACTLAASIALMLLRQQDSTGLITYDANVRQIVPPRSAEIHIDAICKALHISRPKDKTDIFKILRRVAEATAARGMIVLVSDLFVDRELLFKGLEMLKHGRHDLLVLHIMDEDELKFPFAGTTRFEGMEEIVQLTCDPRALRDGYIEALEDYLIEVRRGCARLGIDYSLVHTGEYLDAVLAKFLHRRMAMSKWASKT
jgi:uncharacterized protein (DUF58 family)